MAAAHDVPTSATVLLPHASSSVRTARRRLALALAESGVAPTVSDDAVLILSELLSNALRHARPLANGDVRVGWRLRSDGLLEVEVTDGGGPTRPQQSTPSISARGGRGLDIITALAGDWGVRESPTETTVWAVLAVRARHARRDKANAPEDANAADADQPADHGQTPAAGGGRRARQTTRMPSHRAPHESPAEPEQGKPADPATGSGPEHAGGGLNGFGSAGPPDGLAPLRRRQAVGDHPPTA